MKKWHEEWFEYAQNDIAFARSGLRDGFFSYVCLLAQQAVEKGLKGYLVFQDKRYPKTHGLIELYGLIGRPGWLEPHLGALKTLAEFYAPLRYPDAAGTLPGGSPDEKVAKKALTWAEEILSLIESKTR